MRKAAIALAAVFVVLALAVVLVPRLVSLESFKPRIVAALEEKTGRDVALSRLSLSLFPGIRLKVEGLTVSGDARHPGENLLSVPEAEVRMAILPLLSGRVLLDRLVLSRPEILFRSYADGTHSAADLAARLGATGRAPAAAPGGGVSLDVRSVGIEDAELLLRIEEKDRRETRWDIRPLNVRLGGIGGRRSDFEISTRVDGAVRGEIAFSGSAVRGDAAAGGAARTSLRAEGTVFGQKAAVEGTVSAAGGGAEAALAATFPAIELDRLASALSEPPPALRDAGLEGRSAVTVTVRGSGRAAEFTAEADLTGAGWTVSRDPRIRKPVGVPCRVTIRGEWAPDRLRVSRASLDLPHIAATATGRAVPSTGEREWSFAGEIPSLAGLGGIGGAGLSAFSPEGRLSVSGKGARKRAGAAEEYALAAELGEAGLRLPGGRVELRSLSGRVTVTPRAVAFSPLAGLLNGQRFSLRGTVGRQPDAAGQVDVRMAYLDVDALVPPGKEGAKPGAAASDGEAKRREEAPSWSTRANLAIDAGKARGIEFQDLEGTARYEGGVLFLDSVRARMYGGDVSVSGRVALSGPSQDFRVKLAAKNVAAGDVLARKTSLGDLLAGAASLSVDLGGGLESFDHFARTATGAGSLRVADGRIKGVNLLEAAAGRAGLSSLLPGTAGGRPGDGKGETAFSDLSAEFRIDGGKIRTDALRIVSEKMELSGSAAIGFDRTLEFRGTLRMSGELSSRIRGKAGKFLLGPGGRVEIPLQLTGPLSSPSVAIDARALAEGTGERILRGVTEKLREKPPSSADNVPRGGADERPAPAREAEELFRRLLRGK